MAVFWAGVRRVGGVGFMLRFGAGGSGYKRVTTVSGGIVEAFVFDRKVGVRHVLHVENVCPADKSFW